MYVTMSISIGLYPNLDLWNANKLHYITLHCVQTGSQAQSASPTHRRNKPFAGVKAPKCHMWCMKCTMP